MALLINEASTNLFLKAYDEIKPEDFYHPFHVKLFEYLTKLVITHGGQIDKSLISGKISTKKEKALLEEIISISTSIDNLKQYISEIRNSAKLRRVKEILSETQYYLSSESDPKADDIIGNIEDGLITIVNNQKFDFYEPKDIVPNMMQEILGGKKAIELSTSFKEMDAITRGIQPKYIILAGRPSMGKTELALQWCIHNAERGNRVAIFSLEMDETELMARIISHITEIPLTRILTGELDNKELDHLQKSIARIEAMPIHIDASAGMSANQMAAKLRRLKIKYPDLKMAMIDYIGLMSGADEDSEHSQIQKISRIMKNISRSLNIATIVLSQLNRGVESREDKRPRLSDLRSSGSLEQDADLVFFLYCEGYYDRQINSSLTELILAKNRNGPLGTAIVNNNKEIQKFKEIGDKR